MLQMINKRVTTFYYYFQVIDERRYDFTLPFTTVDSRICNVIKMPQTSANENFDCYYDSVLAYVKLNEENTQCDESDMTFCGGLKLHHYEHHHEQVDSSNSW